MPKGRKRSPVVRKTRRKTANRHRGSRSGTVRRWPLWLAAGLLAGLVFYLWQSERIDGWIASLRSPAPVETADTDPPPQPPPPTPPDDRYDLPDVARQEPPAADKAVKRTTRAARIALVIDDLGRSVEDVDRIAALGVPITYAVLPFESSTNEVRERIAAGGHELICHLPMEPANGANPGPGALTSKMGRRQLAKATRRALEAVPGAVGVNNHMGSSLTADRRAMRAILKVIGNRGLYFLDSRTSADSVGFALAREMAIPSVERRVFLDGELTPEWVTGQFQRALEIARDDGAAVVIGHPHDVTLTTLEELIPEAAQAGYEFVEVSMLLERSSSPEVG